MIYNKIIFNILKIQHVYSFLYYTCKYKATMTINHHKILKTKWRRFSRSRHSIVLIKTGVKLWPAFRLISVQLHWFHYMMMNYSEYQSRVSTDHNVLKRTCKIAILKYQKLIWNFICTTDIVPFMANKHKNESQWLT